MTSDHILELKKGFEEAYNISTKEFNFGKYISSRNYLMIAMTFQSKMILELEKELDSYKYKGEQLK